MAVEELARIPNGLAAPGAAAAAEDDAEEDDEEDDKEEGGRVMIIIPAGIKQGDTILLDLPGGTQV